MTRCPYYPIKCYPKKKDRTDCPQRCEQRTKLTTILKRLDHEKKSLFPLMKK